MPPFLEDALNLFLPEPNLRRFVGSPVELSLRRHTSEAPLVSTFLMTGGADRLSHEGQNNNSLLRQVDEGFAGLRCCGAGAGANWLALLQHTVTRRNRKIKRSMICLACSYGVGKKL